MFDPKNVSFMCVDIFYEISAQLRHLVWCTLLLVYVVWAARAQCPVSARHPRHPGEERREKISNLSVSSDR